MTSVDRFDQSLPDALAEIGRSDASRLIEDVLARTESMGQRPAWRQTGTWLIGASAPEPRSVGRSTWIVLAVVLLMAALLAVAVAGALGPTPPIHRADVVLPSSPSPITTDAVTPPPSGAPAPSPTPGAPSQSTVQLGGQEPCPAMFQLLSTWVLDDPSAPIPAGSPQRTLGNDDIVYMSGSQRPGVPGFYSLGRVSTGVGGPTLRAHADDQVFPSDPVSDARARIVPSPDGRAMAVEEGDLGAAGCGDPLVLLADGGARRPFPSGAFQFVSDLAWAPDGSALYGVRRPTIAPTGQPYFNRETGEVMRGPGTVLRWDVATGKVTELGGSCGPCGPLFVSPDGTRLASSATATGTGTIYVHEEGTWRALTTGRGLVGWSDASSIVLLDGRRVGLDGSTLTEWNEPCCHGTGFGGPLSADGTMVAGMTLDKDFIHHSLTILDVRDGTSLPSGPFRTCAVVPASRRAAAAGRSAMPHRACHPAPRSIHRRGSPATRRWSPGRRTVAQSSSSTCSPTRTRRRSGSSPSTAPVPADRSRSR